MSDYEIIDVHIHSYQSAQIGIQAQGGEKICGYDGSIESTLSYLEKEGVSKCVMVNLLPSGDMRDVLMDRLPFGLQDYSGTAQTLDATLIKRTKRRNDWSLNQSGMHPELITFITIDPIMDPLTMQDEISEKVTEKDAKGIKLHPCAQRFYPFDRRLWPCYEAAQELNIPVVVHSGDFSAYPVQYALPKYYLEVLASFPKLPLVLAHIAKPFWDEAKMIAQRYPSVNFDTTGVLSKNYIDISDDFFVSIVREIGVERVMFGTDFPFIDPNEQIERMKRLTFTEEEKQLVFSGNAKRIYRI